MPAIIKYFSMTPLTIGAQINIVTFSGFVNSTLNLIQNTVTAFLKTFGIGQTVYLNWVVGVASLIGNPVSQTFAIESVLLANWSGGPPAAADVPIPFNAAPTAGSVLVYATGA
jgi:hypothetical protein